MDELYSAQGAVAERLGEIQKQLDHAAQIDTALNPRLEAIGSVLYQVEETADELRDYLQNIEFDSNRLEEIEDRLDTLNRQEDIRVLLIMGTLRKSESEDYVDLFRRIMISDSGGRQNGILGGTDIIYSVPCALARFCNAINQLVMKIVQIDPFVIHADSGNIISPFLNLSLACDYRIVSSNN